MVKGWEEEDLLFDETFLRAISEKVKIIDILDLLKIDYAKVSSGKFDYRARCPFQSHSNGNERTPSFYVSNNDNTYNPLHFIRCMKRTFVPIAGFTLINDLRHKVPPN